MENEIDENEIDRAMIAIVSYVVRDEAGEVVRYGHCPAADITLQEGPGETATAEEYQPE